MVAALRPMFDGEDDGSAAGLQAGVLAAIKAIVSEPYAADARDPLHEVLDDLTVDTEALQCELEAFASVMHAELVRPPGLHGVS